MSDKKPAGDRLEYTGQTTGHITLDGEHLADVKPGDVLEPTDAHHRKQLEKTGHFVATTKKATHNPGPEALPVVADAPTSDTTPPKETP